MQLKSSIPIEWKEKLKQCSQMPKNIPSGNTIKIINTIKTIEKVTFIEFDWHLMNTDPYTPIAVQKWSSHYPTFNEACTNVLHRILKLPFKTVRDTKIQTFQYRIIQKIIPCNKLLHNIKIKSSPNCDYWNNEDNFPHYFIRCQKVAELWTQLVRRSLRYIN